MAEEQTQTTESVDNPSGGSSQAGSGGGGAGGSDRIAQLEAELARERERTRSFQGQADRARAESGAVTERLSKVEEMLGKFDPEAVADQFTARFNQQQALAAAKAKLREEFKLARPEVFEGHDSPEAMRAAVESSHKAESDYRESVRREEEARILTSLKEAHPGVVFTPTPQTTSGAEGSGEQTSGELSARDLATMSTSDYLALSDEQIAAAEKRL